MCHFFHEIAKIQITFGNRFFDGFRILDHFNKPHMFSLSLFGKQSESGIFSLIFRPRHSKYQAFLNTSFLLQTLYVISNPRVFFLFWIKIVSKFGHQLTTELRHSFSFKLISSELRGAPRLIWKDWEYENIHYKHVQGVDCFHSLFFFQITVMFWRSRTIS